MSLKLRFFSNLRFPRLFALVNYSTRSLTHLTKFFLSIGDCKLPVINNALIESSSSVIAHSSELNVRCGDEIVVLKCEHGSWDQTLVFCPGKCLNV